MQTTTEETKQPERGLTLRSLVENELAVMAMLYESGGEITPAIAEVLKLSENAMPEKVDGYAHMIDRLRWEVERLNEIKQQYTSMIASLERAEEWMKETLKASMLTLERDELTGVDRKFRLQKASPRLEVIEEHLPADYMEEVLVYKRNTEKIKKDLANGVKVPGARLVESYYVRAYANPPAKIAEKKAKATKPKEVQ